MARQYKLARKMKKITLTVAAEDLGVSQPTLSAWESGRRSPTIEALIRMSEYYGVTVDFLLGKAKESDSRVDMTLPVSKEMLPALHEAPVYSPKNGWAFVDAVFALQPACPCPLPMYRMSICCRRCFPQPPHPNISRSPRQSLPGWTRCGWSLSRLISHCGRNCEDGIMSKPALWKTRWGNGFTSTSTEPSGWRLWGNGIQNDKPGGRQY